MTRLLAAILLVSSFPLAAAAVPDRAAAEAAIQTAKVNGDITIAYRVTGPAKGRPIVLLPGIGMQLIEWPPALIAGLERDGHRVIALELRDSGGSTHFTAAGAPDWGAVFAALGSGKPPPSAYTADDMMRDVVGLLDHLKIARADVLGISGGATIGELLAIAHPARVRSLVVIAANSGNPAVAIPANPARFAGQAQPQPNEAKAAMVARRIDTNRRLAGPASAFDEAGQRAIIEAVVARDADPFGTQRQGIPLLALGDIRARLKAITAPTLVIHGAADPLIAPQLGKEVADAIPGATYLPIEGMGHEMASNQIPAMLRAVKQNAARAR